MDDRDWAAPIALPRHTPIAQAIGNRPFAAAQCFEPLARGSFRFSHRQAVEESRIKQRAVLDIGVVANRIACRVGSGRQHHRDHRQPVFAGEFEIALVMPRAAKDGTGAVLHQHEIGDIDRHATVRIKRVDRFEAGGVSALFGSLDDRLASPHPVALGDELGEPGIVFGKTLGQRVIRRQCHKRRAKQRILSRRKNLDLLVAAGNIKIDACPFRAANPVFLHQPHALGPPAQLVKRVKQLLGERSDAQKPLR